MSKENQSLITKYRPITFDECVGNKEIIQKLAASIKSKSHSHSYLFTGVSGIGKTTLARVIANEVDASIMEMDAASNNGVEDTRRLVDTVGFKPVTGKNKLLVIIDECHALSKNAWQPLLKTVEEPPDYLYFALCTTESEKVPPTIKTRCYPVALKPINPIEIADLLETVAELEGWVVENNVFQAIVQGADGSARRALSILQAGHSCVSKEELGKVIEGIDVDDKPAIKLAKALLKGVKHWKAISQYLAELDGQEEEAIFTMSRYFAAVIVKSEEEQAQHIYRMLRSFTETDTWDHRVHFYTAIGKILWGQLPF